MCPEELPDGDGVPLVGLEGGPRHHGRDVFTHGVQLPDDSLHVPRSQRIVPEGGPRCPVPVLLALNTHVDRSGLLDTSSEGRV